MRIKKVIVIGCCDPRLNGRMHEIEHHLGAKAFPLRKPGPDRAITRGTDNEQGAVCDECQRLIVEVGDIEMIVIVSHGDCLGHQVEDDIHREHTREAVERVFNWGYDLPVVGLFRPRVSDTHWLIEEVARLVPEERQVQAIA